MVVERKSQNPLYTLRVKSSYLTLLDDDDQTIKYLYLS